MSITREDAKDAGLRTLAFTRAMVCKDRDGMEALMPTTPEESMQMLTAAAATILYLIDEREDILDALVAAQLAGGGQRQP